MLVRNATLLLANLALASCAATSQGGPAGATPVPWLPLEAGPPVFPTPPPIVIPPGTASCHASDLVASYRGTNGIGGGVVSTGISIGNRAATPCVLFGSPTIRLLNAQGGEIAITSVPATEWAAKRVLLAAHTNDMSASIGAAAVVFDWQSFDIQAQACPNQAPPASILAIRLPGDSTEFTVPTGGDHSTLAPCNSRIRVWPVQGVEPVPPPVPHRLVATITAPTQVGAGERLRYTVSLRNITDEPVTFGSVCPSYVESGIAKEIYALNCRPVGAIAAGGTVLFAMELGVLASVPPGVDTFVWRLGFDFDADTWARGSIRVTP
jgi:hypothetical protein